MWWSVLMVELSVVEGTRKVVLVSETNDPPTVNATSAFWANAHVEAQSMKNRIVKRFIKAPLPAKCLSVFGWLFQPEMQVSQAAHQKKHGLPARVVVRKGQAGGYFEISL